MASTPSNPSRRRLLKGALSAVAQTAMPFSLPAMALAEVAPTLAAGTGAASVSPLLLDMIASMVLEGRGLKPNQGVRVCEIYEGDFLTPPPLGEWWRSGQDHYSIQLDSSEKIAGFVDYALHHLDHNGRHDIFNALHDEILSYYTERLGGLIFTAALNDKDFKDSQIALSRIHDAAPMTRDQVNQLIDTLTDEMINLCKKIDNSIGDEVYASEFNFLISTQMNHAYYDQAGSLIPMTNFANGEDGIGEYLKDMTDQQKKDLFLDLVLASRFRTYYLFDYHEFGPQAQSAIADGRIFDDTLFYVPEKKGPRQWGLSADPIPLKDIPAHFAAMLKPYFDAVRARLEKSELSLPPHLESAATNPLLRTAIVAALKPDFTAGAGEVGPAATTTPEIPPLQITHDPVQPLFEDGQIGSIPVPEPEKVERRVGPDEPSPA